MRRKLLHLVLITASAAACTMVAEERPALDPAHETPSAEAQQAPAPQEPAPTDPTYAVKRHDLEMQVDELKERARRGSVRRCPLIVLSAPEANGDVRE